MDRSPSRLASLLVATAAALAIVSFVASAAPGAAGFAGSDPADTPGSRTLAADPASLQGGGDLGTSDLDDEPSPDCADGVVRDDGTVENAWGWVPSAIDGEYVQEFDGSSVPSGRVGSVCVCWLRTFDDSSIDFDIVFYEDDEGQPAQEPYARVPASLDGVPQGLPGKLMRYDVGDVPVPDGVFYVGPRWDPSDSTFFFVCVDSSETTPEVDLWFRDDRAEDWESAEGTVDPIFDAHRALVVRLAPAEARVVEVPSASTLGLAALALALAGAAAARLRTG